MPTPPSFRGRSGPSRPLSHERVLELAYAYRRLWDTLRDAGIPPTAELTHDYLAIEAEIIRWETRSAKLRYEAKRQRVYRAVAREDGVDAEVGTTLADSDDLLPAATREALARFKAERGSSEAATHSGTAPDTSTYKASGLV